MTQDELQKNLILTILPKTHSALLKTFGALNGCQHQSQYAKYNAMCERLLKDLLMEEKIGFNETRSKKSDKVTRREWYKLKSDEG